MFAFQGAIGFSLVPERLPCFLANNVPPTAPAHTSVIQSASVALAFQHNPGEIQACLGIPTVSLSLSHGLIQEATSESIQKKVELKDALVLLQNNLKFMHSFL